MAKEEELQNSLSETIDYYENYISKLNHQNVMVYAAARNYEDKCKLLQDKLALTEKALELACKEITNFCEYCSYKTMPDCPIEANCLDEKINYFKNQAKEMMKSE